MNMQGKRVLVIGMARSGVAAANMLVELGAQVRISDRKSEKDFGGALDGLKREGVEWRLGESAEALLEGVDQIVVSPGVPADHPAIERAKELGIGIIGELELASRWGQGRLIAVTGTNGKTTTCALTGEVFKNAGKLTYVVGNIGLAYASVALKTKPEDVTVCEISSFQLETIERFHPSITAILNITEDHLDRHGTMAAYAALKARVFENQTAGDYLILNYDDEALRRMAQGVPAHIRWFSRSQLPPKGAFVVGGSIVYGTPEEYRTICVVDEVSIPGAHNLENALAATAIAMCAEVPPPVIRHTLRTFKGVEHRIERVRELDGVVFINDSKGTNVDSTIKAIAAMAKPTVMILGGYDKHVDMDRLCEAIADSMTRKVVLIGNTAGQIQKGLDRVGFTQYVHAGHDFEAAVALARTLAEPGWNVLLSPACASFDMFADYEKRGQAFKQIVNEMEPAAP
jgi:UDP-N-acetylmuramoylalanine--D-glutamate ligase